MRLSDTLWILLLLLLMVLCGAPGCYWERPTDNRGLNRHRTSCHFFNKASVLATEKRRQRARNATLANQLSSVQVSNCFLQMDSDFDAGSLIPGLSWCQQRNLLGGQRPLRAGLTRVRAHLTPTIPSNAIAKPRSTETRALLGAPGPAASHDGSYHLENERNDVAMDSEGPAVGNGTELDILHLYL